MSQPKPWTLVKNGEFYLTLKIDGSDCGIVTSLKVPRQPDYEDEHVLIFCNDSSEPKMLSLNLLDSKGSDFFKQFNVGELSNSADFIKAVLALCPIEAPFSAALRGLSNLDGYANSKEYDRMSNSSELSFELEMPDKINPIDLSDSSSNISAPLLASTPVPKPDPKQRNNKGSKQPFNNTVGIALFDGHRSIGKVIGEELPKFGEIGWPPPFRKTVNIMREFLLNNCGHFRLWTTGSLQFQKAYFNRVFGLHETKSASGNIYLYYKVSELSGRCWELACTIMEKIENGSFPAALQRRRKRVAGQDSDERRVLQSHFQCLSGKDPIKEEETMFKILSGYARGEIPEEFIPPTKKRQNVDPNDSLISKIDELTQRLQTVKDKNKEIITENKELNKTVARLRNDISRCNEDNTTLKMDNEKLKAENEKLLKAIEVEKSNNSFLTTSLEEKEQETLHVQRALERAEKELKKRKSSGKKDETGAKPRATNKEKETVNTAEKRLEHKVAHNQDKIDIGVLESELQTDSVQRSHVTEDPKSATKKDQTEDTPALEAEPSHEDDVATVWEFDIKQLRKNTWVAVIFGDEKFYIGRVEDTNEEKKMVTVKFLKKRNTPPENSFSWPMRNDIQEVPPEIIFSLNVKLVPHGKAFVVTNYDSLCQDAANYINTYM